MFNVVLKCTREISDESMKGKWFADNQQATVTRVFKTARLITMQKYP